MVVNGNVATQNGTSVGSKATYTCNFKYAFTVNSSMKRTCKSSGKWSNERIECGEFVKRSAYFLNNDHFIPVASRQTKFILHIISTVFLIWKK